MNERIARRQRAHRRIDDHSPTSSKAARHLRRIRRGTIEIDVEQTEEEEDEEEKKKRDLFSCKLIADDVCHLNI